MPFQCTTAYVRELCIQFATLTHELRGFLRANGGSVSTPGTRTRRRRLSGLSLRVSLMAVRKTHWDLGEGTREHDTTCLSSSVTQNRLKVSRRNCYGPLDVLIQHQTHQTSQTLKTNVKDGRGLNALNPANIPNPQDQCETIRRAGVVFLRTPAASETFRGGGGDCRQVSGDKSRTRKTRAGPDVHGDIAFVTSVAPVRPRQGPQSQVAGVTRLGPARHGDSRSRDKGRTRKTKAGPDVNGDP